MISNIKATQIELSQSIREYLDKRLKGLSKLIDTDDTSVRVEVELSRATSHHHSGDAFKAEINVFVGGKTFRAVGQGTDLFMAIDLMRDQVLHELRNNKDKRLSLVRRSGQRIKDLMRGIYNKYRR